MSDQSVESILSKAMSDPAFADALFADPEKALAGYELTTEEVAKFKNMSRAEFASLVTEDRKSMATLLKPEGTDPDPNHNETMLTC